MRVLCRYYKGTVALMLVVMVLLSVTDRSYGNDVTTVQSVLQGGDSIKEATEMAGTIAEIPLSAANVLRLPMGLVQVITAPLPGITLVDGFTNIGKGIIAPFDLLINTLALPSRTISSAGKVITPGLIDQDR